MATETVNVGTISFGSVSGKHLTTCKHFNILGVATLVTFGRSKAEAAAFNVLKLFRVADPSMNLIVTSSSTVPQVHADVSMATREVGKKGDP